MWTSLTTATAPSPRGYRTNNNIHNLVTLTLTQSTNQPITHLCVAALGQLFLVRFPAGHVDGDRVEQDAHVRNGVGREPRLEERLDRPCAGELERKQRGIVGRKETIWKRRKRNVREGEEGGTYRHFAITVALTSVWWRGRAALDIDAAAHCACVRELERWRRGHNRDSTTQYETCARHGMQHATRRALPLFSTAIPHVPQNKRIRNSGSSSSGDARDRGSRALCDAELNGHKTDRQEDRTGA